MSLIRTTWNHRLTTLANTSSRLASRLGAAQEEAATGAKVTRPSDSPSDVSRILSLRSQGERQETYASTASTADGLLSVADQALGGISDALADARELAVAMASGTLNDQQRQDAATSASAIFSRVVDLANAQVGGRYVFAGLAYDTEPFQDDGTYVGAAGQPSSAVSDVVDVPLGYDGGDTLRGSTDVLAAIDALVSALGSGDADAVATTLDALTDATEHVSALRSQVGCDQNLALDAQDLIESMQTEVTRQLSSLTDADAVMSYTKLFELQSTYDAALQVTASTRSTSLFAMM